ncbi:hypothetical protein B0H13DRAFT_2577354 [Mycena leptocephala]|nr:hypothetical protein B0H13DRAFT_2577354 [Mycena leptocephala]
MRLCASLLVNLTTALLVRAQADNAVSNRSLFQLPILRLPANASLALGRSGTPRRLGWPSLICYPPRSSARQSDRCTQACFQYDIIRGLRRLGLDVLSALRDGAWVRYFVRVQSRMDRIWPGRRDTETRTPQMFYLFAVETLNMGFGMAMMYQSLCCSQQLDYFRRGASVSLPMPVPIASLTSVYAVFLPEPTFVARPFSVSAPLFPHPIPIPIPSPPVLVSTPIHRLAFVPVLTGCFVLVTFGVVLFLLGVKRYMAMHTKGGEVAIPSSKGGDGGGPMAVSTGAGSVVSALGRGAGIQGHAARGGDDKGRGGETMDGTGTEGEKGRRGISRRRGRRGGGQGRGVLCCACSLLLFAASFFLALIPLSPGLRPLFPSSLPAFPFRPSLCPPRSPPLSSPPSFTFPPPFRFVASSSLPLPLPLPLPFFLALSLLSTPLPSLFLFLVSPLISFLLPAFSFRRPIFPSSRLPLKGMRTDQRVAYLGFRISNLGAPASFGSFVSRRASALAGPSRNRLRTSTSEIDRLSLLYGWMDGWLRSRRG